jgi:hypothetical protein
MVSTISATVMARICSMVLLAGSCVLFVAKRLRWRGWDSNPRTPKGRDHSSLAFFSTWREEMLVGAMHI